MQISNRDMSKILNKINEGIVTNDIDNENTYCNSNLI